MHKHNHTYKQTRTHSQLLYRAEPLLQNPWTQWWPGEHVVISNLVANGVAVSILAHQPLCPCKQNIGEGNGNPL